jgi:hypothetical protein
MSFTHDMIAVARLGLLAVTVSCATASNADQEVNRGPTPWGDPVPAYVPRAPQPYTIEYRDDGTIVETGGIEVQPVLIPAFPDLPEFVDDSKQRQVIRPEPWPGPFMRATPATNRVLDLATDPLGEPETLAPPVFQDFDGIGPNGLDPPDPDIAVGPNHIVMVTNDDFAVYDKCGNELFRADANDYFPNADGPGTLIFDPKVIYDPWNNRWVMMYHERNFDTGNELGRMRIAYTQTSLPPGLGAVWTYTYNLVQNAGTADASWPDYFDLGYSQDYITISGNMFEFPNNPGNNGSRPFRWARIVVFDKAQVYNGQGSANVSFSNLQNPDNSRAFGTRACQQQWQFGGLDGVFLDSRPGGGSEIVIRKLTDAFGANNLTVQGVAVAPYSAPSDAGQPNGATLDTIDARLMPCVLTNDIANGNGLEIFTALTTGNTSGTSDAKLMKFDAASGALEFDQNFFATGWWYWFATPAADYAGNCYWIFSRSGNGAGQEAELRFVEMNRGNFSNVSGQIQDGLGSRNQCFNGSGQPIACRWGDYFGAQLDWGDYNTNFNEPERPAKVWMVGEYARPNNWSTRIAASSVFDQGTVSTVTPSSTWNLLQNAGSVSAASRVYNLTNTGEVGTAFTVTGLPSWLNASVEEGIIYPAGRSVTLSLDVAAANQLCGGVYNATVVFRDCFNSGNSFGRSVSLTINAPELAVNSVDADDGSYFPGETLGVDTIFGNTGNASISFLYDIRLSTNTFISVSDALLLETSTSVSANSTTSRRGTCRSRWGPRRVITLLASAQTPIPSPANRWSPGLIPSGSR